MKALCQLLLMFSVLAAGLWAKEESASKGKAASPARELVWPEITNARALIKLAKSEISELEPDDDRIQSRGVLDHNELITYLKPLYAVVGRDFMMIMLDTHPLTGQAFVIAPQPKILAEKYPGWFDKVQDTDVSEIKRVLGKLPVNSPRHLAMLGEVRVWWKELINESPDTASCPYPIKIMTPGYREDMASAAINGEAKVTFTVTETGEVRDVVVKATHVEFAVPTEEAIKLWKFEPGVDRNTRLPVAVRVSVTAVFKAVD